MSNQKDPKDFLYEGERLDDLQRDGMYIIQNPKVSKNESFLYVKSLITEKLKRK